MVIFHSYVILPEGKTMGFYMVLRIAPFSSKLLLRRAGAAGHVWYLYDFQAKIYVDMSVFWYVFTNCIYIYIFDMYIPIYIYTILPIYVLPMFSLQLSILRLPRLRAAVSPEFHHVVSRARALHERFWAVSGGRGISFPIIMGVITPIGCNMKLQNFWVVCLDSFC